MSRASLILLSLVSASCYATRAEMAQQAKQIARVNQTLSRLDQLIQRLERRAFCPPVVKDVLEAVWDGMACKPDQVCEGNQAIAGLSDADPSGQGRFLSLLGSQPYVALYPVPQQDTDDKPTFFVPELQRKRLEKLIEPPWLPITRFLIVSNSGRDNRNATVAKRRISWLLGYLKGLSFKDQGYAEDRFLITEDNPQISCPVTGEKTQILRWVFNYDLKPGEVLNYFDRPPAERTPAKGRGAAKKNGAAAGAGQTLEDSIFIFRVDCPLRPPSQPPRPPKH